MLPMATHSFLWSTSRKSVKLFQLIPFWLETWWLATWSRLSFLLELTSSRLGSDQDPFAPLVRRLEWVIPNCRPFWNVPITLTDCQLISFPWVFLPIWYHFSDNPDYNFILDRMEDVLAPVMLPKPLEPAPISSCLEACWPVMINREEKSLRKTERNLNSFMEWALPLPCKSTRVELPNIVPLKARLLKCPTGL